jgi:energy-converting hydrogenase A subunit M
MISGQQLWQRYQQEIQAVEQERSALSKQRLLGRDNQQAIAEQLNVAWQDTVEALLPTIDAARLQELSSSLGIGALHPATVATRGQEAMATAQATVQRITSDDRYQRREELEASIQIRQAELKDASDSLRSSVEALQNHERFQQLCRFGYDTSFYQHKWWQMQFYDDWRDADLIAAERGADSFSALRSNHQRDREGLAELDRGLAEESARLVAMKKMTDDLAAAQHILAHPTQAMLHSVRAILRDRIEELGAEPAAAMLGANGSVLARVSALSAKQRYLGDINSELIGDAEKQAIQLQDKLVREVAKLSRAKNRFRDYPTDELDRRFPSKRLDRIRTMRERAHHTRLHIYNYDRYDRYSPVENFLWWDVMSDGQLDGNFIHEVRTHHHHHDHHHETRDHDRSLSMDAS